MPSSLRRACAWLGIGVLPVLAWSADYHVAPGGDDAQDGSTERPWKTLAAANAAVRAGDTVTVHDGAYAGIIAPEHSGRPGAPIVYRAARPFGAEIRGEPDLLENSACIRLEDREHVEIDGFVIRPIAGRLMWLDGVRGLTIRRCRMTDSTIAWESILMRNTHDSRFEDLECGRTLRIGGNWGHVTGNLWDIYASSRLVFERIHFHRTGHHSLGIWHDSHDIVIRQCVFEGIWGRNFELATPLRLLMEQCVITQAFDGANSADARGKFFARDAIFRHNVVHHNYGGPLAAVVWARPSFYPVLALRRSRFYQNTFAHNYDPVWLFGDIDSQPSGGGIEDNVFQNENYAFNDLGGDGIAMVWRSNVAASNTVRSSNFYAGVPGRPGIVRQPSGAPGDPEEAVPLDPSAAESGGPVQFLDTLSVDPGFVAGEAGDYRLQARSPLIDAGRPLARVAESGSGRILPVDDARWFYDGYGIPGEEGDLIVVGPDQRTARVVAVDGEFNTLSLDRDLSWSEGEAVTLPYAGVAPDIGAYESQAEAQPWYRAPRSWDGPRLATMATATDVVVRTSFEPEEREAWFHFWNFSRRPNTTAALDATTAGGGRQSVRIHATADRAVLGCDIRPAEWLIDRFPTVRFKYRIPHGVPVGLWLQAYDAAGTVARRVCIGGTATRNIGGERDLDVHPLVDDDQWHELEVDARLVREVFPDVKVLWAFAFHTAGNGKFGDQFWFDDFVILPSAAAAPRTAGHPSF